MRVESTVMSVSWIPSEAIKGLSKLPFGMGVAHYDDAPPDLIDGTAQLEELRQADRFRFANVLQAWIEVEDGRIVDHGQSGGGSIGATTIGHGRAAMTFPAVALPTSDRHRSSATGRSASPRPPGAAPASPPPAGCGVDPSSRWRPRWRGRR
jgi:hypothetical protein